MCSKYFDLSLEKEKLQKQLHDWNGVEDIEYLLRDFLGTYCRTYQQFIEQAFQPQPTVQTLPQVRCKPPEFKSSEPTQARSTGMRFASYSALFKPGQPDQKQAEQKASLEKLKKEWEATLKTL